MKHLCAKASQFQHLIIGYHVYLLCILHNSWVCRIYAVHVCIDLAFIRVQHRCQRYRRRIGAAPSKRRDIVIFINALEARYNYNLPGIQLVGDPLRIHALKTRISVAGCGMHHYLERIQGYCRYIQSMHCHCHQ